MKNELMVKGFSTVNESEMLEIDGGILTGTTALIVGTIAFVAGVSVFITVIGRDFGWW